MASRVVQVATIASTVIKPVRIGKGPRSVQVDSKVIVVVGGGLAVVGLFGVVKAVARSVAWLFGAKRGSPSKPEQSCRVDDDDEDAISVHSLESQSEFCSYCSLISGLLYLMYSLIFEGEQGRGRMMIESEPSSSSKR